LDNRLIIEIPDMGLLCPIRQKKISNNINKSNRITRDIETLAKLDLQRDTY